MLIQNTEEIPCILYKIVTCHVWGDQRWRPVSRKLSLTISQASSTIPALVTSSGPDSAFNTRSSSRQYSEEGGGDWIVGDSSATEHGGEKTSPQERAPERAVIMVFLVQLIELLWMVVVVVVKLERSGDRGFGVSDFDWDGDGGSVGKEFERARTLIFWLRRVKCERG